MANFSTTAQRTLVTRNDKQYKRIYHFELAVEGEVSEKQKQKKESGRREYEL